MNIYQLRTFLIVLISFMAFLRISELLQLKLGDIKIEESHTAIFIAKSKTDVHSEGTWVFIAKLSSDMCPNKLISKYIRSLNKKDKNQYFYRVKEGKK